MRTTASNNLAFKSIHLPYNNIPVKKPHDLIKPYFELKGYINTTPAKIRTEITEAQAGIAINKDSLTIVGKDREADEFIARQMKKGNIEHKYVQDTPETIFEDPVFEILG